MARFSKDNKRKEGNEGKLVDYGELSARRRASELLHATPTLLCEIFLPTRDNIQSKNTSGLFE